MNKALKACIVTFLVIMCAAGLLVAGMYLNKHIEGKENTSKPIVSERSTTVKAVPVKVKNDVAGDKEKVLSMVKKQNTVDRITVDEKLKKLVKDFDFDEVGWEVKSGYDGLYSVTYTYRNGGKDIPCSWTVDVKSGAVEAESVDARLVMTEKYEDGAEDVKTNDVKKDGEKYNGIELDVSLGDETEIQALKKSIDGFKNYMKEADTAKAKGNLCLTSNLTKVGYSEDNGGANGGIYLKYSHNDSIDVDDNSVYTCIFDFKFACSRFALAVLPQIKEMGRFIDFYIISVVNKKGDEMRAVFDGHVNLDLQPNVIYMNGKQVNNPLTAKDFGLNQRGIEIIKAFLENK